MPPLATWSQMLDGTLTLEDVAEMHLVQDEVERAVRDAMEG